ncbi:MAG TPA: PEP-CTERM sorting domain-containing protein [Candidatus Limnocylindrales bacterium]|nr:PEP-CTERM sorting domain-containing protein [Candidatus Limnocylindrales bacterium]
MHKLRVHWIVLAFAATALTAMAQNNPLITLNEHGQGTLLFPGGGSPITTTGVLIADPGPGGLPSALTYNLLGPPGLVAGDLLIFESLGVSAVLSDIVRFNPAGTAPGYPASAVFYSDINDGADAIADTGFPTALYANTSTMLEVGPEGANGVLYTPTAGQPGFVSGFSVSYNVISDDTPEPASIGLVGLAVAGLVEAYRRRRQ